MKLKRNFNPLRIGKGLLCLLALFVMLLSPQRAWAEDYDLWIGNVRVTDANKDDLAAANSNIKVGNATFDSENNILYLNGIQTKDCIKSELASLRISLQGANRIGYIANADDHPAIYSEETHGTLAIMKPQNYASLYVESMMVESVIYGFSSFNFSTVSVSPSENVSYSTELGLNDGETGIETATFYTGSLYPIWIGKTQVTSANLSDIKDDNISAGTVSYNPTANVLTLNNVIIDMASDDPYVVESSIADLKVRLVGENEVTLDAERYGTTGPNPIAFANFTGTAGETSPTLTFKSEWDKNESSFGSLTIKGAATETIIAQGYTVSNTWVTDDNITNGWKKTINSDNVKVWYRGDTYDLTINGVKVTTDNADNVLEGFGSGVISFNASTNTLTFNDLMDYPEDEEPYITNGLESLTIHLLGNSRILGNNTYFLAKSGNGEGNNTVTFTTDSENPGNLEFYGSNYSPFYTGHTVNWQNGLGWRFDGDSDYGSSAYISADNGLSVGNVILCDNDGNAFNEGPFGDSVTFDEDTNTLTLNNATINGNIVSKLAGDLTVHLVGTNVIHNDQYAFLMTGNGSLKFTAAEDGGKLLTDATTDDMFAYSTSGNGGSIELGIDDLPSGYKLSFDAELKRSIGESYDVLIYAFTNGSSNLGPQCITSANCDRLAGAYNETTSTWDNETITLSYDYATTTLTLNNLNIETASPNGTVYFINCDGSKAKNITINLLGENKLRQFEGEEGARFIYNGAEDGSITVTTDPDEPGTLTMPDMPSTYEETDVLGMYYTNHVKYENGLGYVKDENNVRYIKTVPSLGLMVAGITVNAGNAANVLDQVNEDTELPTVVFDAENNILTLNGAEINVGSNDAIVSGLDSLTVFLVGENIIFCYGDKVFNKTSAVDEAKITFITDEESNGSLYFMCGEDYIFGEGVTPFYTNLSLKHDGDSHTIDSSLGLSVAGVAVTPFNQSNVLGTPEGTTPTVSFTPAVASPATPAKLTLNNANFEGTITWDNSADLTVEILGSNTVDTQHRTFLEGNEDASLTLTTNSTNPGNLLLTSCYSYQVLSEWKNESDFFYDKDNLEMDALDYDWYLDGYSEEWHVRFNKKYNLWVNDVQLCDAQNEVAFDPDDYNGNRISFEDGMLKFNNVSKNTDESPFIVNGVGDLTILLQGENTVNCGQLFLGKKTGDADHKVTFKTTEELEGTLVITTTGDEDDPWYEGHDTPTVKDLIFTDKMIEETRTLTFSEPTPYDLSVAGVTVTNANATAITGENFTGTVSFDAENNILTLNGATINGRIFSELEGGLTVHLLGSNVIDGGYVENDNDHAGEIAFVTEGEEVPLTFTTDAENPGQLLMKNTARDDSYAQFWSGFTPSFTNGLTYTTESNKRLIATAPVMTPGEGLYWTDQTYTISGLTGATIKYKDNLGKISETTYNGEFTIGTAGKYFMGVWQTLKVDNTDFNLYGNNDIYIVHNKPGFSEEAGEYTGTQNITLTNLPANLSANTTSYPQVWYYLGDNEQDSIQYTSAEQEIAVSESTKVCVYILDKDSGKVIKSKSVEAEYTILKNPDLHFWTSENSYMQTGGSYGTVNFNGLESFTSPTLKGKIGNSYTNELTDLGITYSSSDKSVATVDATGKVTIVGGGYVTIKAVSQQTDVYAADSTWYEIGIRPTDPQFSLAKGVYYTGKKVALTSTMPNGKMYYSIGYDGTLTEYTDSITLPVGANDIYAYTRCGTEEKPFDSYGNSHTVFFVYDKPVFSVISGTYDDPQEVTITTNIPENDYYASVYYKLNNSTTDSTLYTNGDKITISETTRVCAYYCVQESDKYVSDPVEAYYVIRQNAGLAFVQGEGPVEVAEYIIGGNESLPLPTLQNENNLTVTYSSEDENVATVNASGVVTIVGMGETLIKATSEETDEFIEGYASYPLRVYKDLSHEDITVEVADAIYTSEAVTPEVTVKDGNTDITELLNIVYSNNVNAGSNAIVTITPNYGLDDPNYYYGSATANFSIDYRTLADGEVTFHNNWATFYNAVGDVNLPAKTGAYIVTEVNNDRVIVTQIKNVPQGVAVLLNNNTTTTTENTTVTGNKLMHASQEVNTSTGSAIYYGLYNGAMKRIYGTIPEGKNYLMLSTAIAPQNAPQLNIVIGNDGNTTGISQTESRESEVENVYDLQGRKIQKPSKNGMYIKNGRKVLINNNNRY